MARVRLRQVALVAPELEPWTSELASTFGVREPYRDPGVSEFGLQNVVFEMGESFLEIVAPVRDGTTAGRLLDKRRGAGGYMVIFQVGDLELARERIDALGVRVVWRADLADIAGTHLHPKDVPGAIVSVDWASPSESWRWAGPRWTGAAPPGARGGLTSVTIGVRDPASAAQRWAQVLDVECTHDRHVVVDDGQRVVFVESQDAEREGIVDVTFAAPALLPGEVEVGSVTVRVQGDGA